MSLFVTFYTVAILLLIWYKKFIFLALVLSVLALHISIAIHSTKAKIEKTKQMVSEKKEKHFININKDSWEILAEIPHLTRIDAKKAVFIRQKSGKFKTVEDFISKMKIEEEEKAQDILDVICI